MCRDPGENALYADHMATCADAPKQRTDLGNLTNR